MSPTRITLAFLRLLCFFQQLMGIFCAQQSGFIDYPDCLILLGVVAVAVQQSGDGVALDTGFFGQYVRGLGTRCVAGDLVALLSSELSD